MEIYLVRIAAIIGIILAIIIATVCYLHFKGSLWLQTVFMGVPVNPIRLGLMRMRKVDPAFFLEMTIKSAKGNLNISFSEIESLISSNGGNTRHILDAAIMAARAGVNADFKFLQSYLMAGGDVKALMDVKILADKAGLETDLSSLAAHHLARGNIRNLVEAMNISNKAGYGLNFNLAAAIDLSGLDILEVVRTAVHPKVITTQPVTAVAQDGIQMTASARVTIETNLEQVIGGAGEDTILARISEGLVSAISSSKSQNILQSPYLISDAAWLEDADDDTGFNILSVEIENIEAGENIGAARQIKQAEADAKLAQAEADKKQHEIRSRMMEMRVKFMEEEAKLPSVLADAFSSGKLSAREYYRLRSLRSLANKRAVSKEANEDEDNE